MWKMINPYSIMDDFDKWFNRAWEHASKPLEETEAYKTFVNRAYHLSVSRLENKLFLKS